MIVNITPYPKDGERTVSVEIHEHDLWNLDITLAEVIHPSLVKLKETKSGVPTVDNEDLPPELHSLGIEERWNWVMDEMIWAFAQIIENDVPSALQPEHESRVQHGTILFGKYYRALWD